MRALGFVSVIVSMIVLAGVPAAAQTPEPEVDEPATFQDATGVVWGMATFEIATTLGAVVPAALGCETEICSGLGPVVGMVAGVSLGLAGWLADWPADVPLVAHVSYLGFAGGMMLGYGITGLSGAEDAKLAVSLISGAAMSLGMGLYTAIRRDDLVRDPNVVVPAHLLAWGTMGALALVGVPLALAEVDDAVLATVIGATATLFFAGMIVWIEAARGDTVEPAPTPLLTLPL